MAASYMPIGDVLARLDLAQGSDFELVLSMAKRVHRHRFEAKITQIGDGITRTSLFVACILANKALSELLAPTEFSPERYLSVTGAAGADFDGEPVEWPSDVGEQLAAGLSAYADSFRGRPVDAVALAFAIVSIAGDGFEQAFGEAGGRLDEAQKRLLAYLSGETSHSGAPAPATVDLTRWKLERHVEAALHRAWMLSEGRPVDAANLLRGALEVAGEAKSEAFAALASLLNASSGISAGSVATKTSASQADLTQVIRFSNSRSVPLSAYPLSDAMVSAFRVARPFLDEGGGSVWGRDYVTLAVLAYDPPLSIWLRMRGTTTDALRAGWYDFLITSKGHRKPDEWSRWWDAAGVSRPDAGRIPPEKLWSLLPGALQIALNRIRNARARSIGTNAAASFSPLDLALAVVDAEPGSALSDLLLRVLGFSASQTPIDLWDRLGLVRDSQPTAPDPPGELGFDDEAISLLGEARALQNSAGGEDRIAPAGLAAVFLRALAGATDALSTDLSAFPPGLAARARVLARELASTEAEGSLSEEDHRVWLQAFPVPASREHFDTIEFADDWVEFHGADRIDDLLGFRPTARRLATLLAAPVPREGSGDAADEAGSRDPILRGRRPIAIGLFGAWGSGKSTFMRLMREELDRIRDSAATFFGLRPLGVRKIYFNAWHYADADLWACLGAHIFEELAKREGYVPEDEVAKTLASLHLKLASSERGLERAKRAREDAARRRAEAEERLRESRRRAAERQRSLFQATVATVGDIKTRLASEDGVETLRRLGSLAQAAGIAFDAKSLDDLAELSRQLRANARASRVLLSDLGQLLRPPWLALIVAATVSAACLWLVQKFGGLWVPGGLLASVVSAWSWALARLQQGQERAERLIAELRTHVPGPDAELARLRQELQDAEAALAQDEARLAGAQEELDDAEGRLAYIEGGGLVYDFAAERAGSDGYGGRLGIVSSLRRDFERLDQLLSGYGRHHAQMQAADTVRDGKPGADDLESRLPVAERVVLFIDDLDRCEPSRVVEVLQAVHLLLAFPLFSVVVAVDPRWLAWSLEETYGRKDVVGPSRASPVFSPQDYLEKIFQIPFSLQGMGESGFGRLVESILKGDESRQAPDQGGVMMDHAGLSGAGAGARAASPGPDVNKAPDQGNAGGTAGEIGAAAATGSSAGQLALAAGSGISPELRDAEKAAVEQRRAETRRRQDEARKQRQRFRALAVPEEERAFLILLHPFLATPRETKRFLNIYRLLRVQAGEIGADYLEYFSSQRDGGEHRAVLLLLALQSGFPSLGPALLRRLDSWWLEVSGRMSLSLGVDRPRQQGLFEIEDWDALIARVAPPEGASDSPRSRLELDVQDVDPLVLGDERRRLRRAVDQVKTSHRGNSPWPSDVFPYAAWAGSVGRFSFGWHLPRSAAAEARDRS